MSDHEITLIDANFDAANDVIGFTFVDGAFGGSTNQPYANGAWGNGALNITLGGIDNSDITDISGGWQQTFTLDEAQDVTLSFVYNLSQQSDYESDEYSEVRFMRDGGPSTTVATLVGDGSGGPVLTTGLQSFTVSLGTLGAGIHTFTIGGYSNKKTYHDEFTNIVIDEVKVIGAPATGPVVETFMAQVNSDDDDAEESASGYVRLGSSDLELVEASSKASSAQTVGIRFTQVNIPQGATITNAYVQFTADEKDSKETELAIFGERVDNAAQFSSSGNNISNRTKTDLSVLWQPETWDTVGRAGAAEQTPDLSDIVQEIVNQADWTANNALAIIITGSGQIAADGFYRDIEVATGFFFLLFDELCHRIELGVHAALQLWPERSWWPARP